MTSKTDRPRIRIIQPTNYDDKGRLFKTSTRWLMGLTLPYLAALTPKDVEVEVIDERLEDIPLDDPVDLVAMSVFTRSARRAYDLARVYRDKNVPVVMGGFHPTLAPQDAAPHADALVVGEAEGVWTDVLQDAAAGRLKPVYQRADFHSLKGLPAPRYQAMPLHKYRLPNMPVQTTRGCPFACSFCEVSLVYGRKYRLRPVDEVIGELQQGGHKSIHFVDDNFAAKAERTMELMERLLPLKLKWTCLLTIKDCRNKALLDLARRSGCCHINIGLESIQPESLKEMHKMQNRVHEYEEALALLRKKGLSYSVNFVFGWDTDSDSTFGETVEFLDRNRVPMAFFSMLSPRMGTRIYDQLKAEGRIIREEAFAGRNVQCMFEPKQMTPRQLEAGLWRVQRQFYSLRSILRRGVFGHPCGGAHVMAANLVFAACSRLRISPLDFY